MDGGNNSRRRQKLVYADFVNKTPGDRVVAGGVHTTILTDQHEVYSCGINEGGTVPVKDLAAEETTRKLTVIEFTEEVKKEGRIVQLTSGAGFTAALTHRGSVIAWGNLRDENGSHGQLGSSARTKLIRSTYMADVTGKSLHRSVLEKSKLIKFSDIFAGGYWTMARATDGRIFACGLNNYGQLGFPLPNVANNGTEGDSEEQNKKLKINRLTYSPAFPSDIKWTHTAGVKHIVARTDDGEVYGIGLNTDNELGIGTYEGKDDEEHWRYFELQKINFADGVEIAGITAALGCSIAWTDDGRAYGFGYDSVGQLGLGITEDRDKSVTTPRIIKSKHLDDYKIISVDLADNHSVFLAVEINE
uniref:Uncharacterized protein n=1 Tax=Panagrolaimus davidi TaxID=227884 RepID=A0A914PCC0_9BILA